MLVGNNTHELQQLWGLPFSMYAPRGSGVGQVSYIFPSCITCKKGGREGVQIACKIVYILNGRPLSLVNFPLLKAPTHTPIFGGSALESANSNADTPVGMSSSAHSP